MRVSSKGQVTIPQAVREAVGIRVSETKVEFIHDDSGRWYLRKLQSTGNKSTRFREAHKAGKVRMSTEELLRSTRGE